MSSRVCLNKVKVMNLEIKSISLPDLEEGALPENILEFNFPVMVEIGEKNKPGAEAFHFVVASPLGLRNEVSQGGFKILRGYVLLEQFSWKDIYRALENLVNHSRHLQTWDKVIEYWSRYCRYDSEDL
jgi:hypothetical protein